MANEKELFTYGDKELNVNSLLNNINSNQQSYLNHYSSSITDPTLFIEKLNYIKDGIKNGNITTDGTGIYYDADGKLSKDDKLMNNVLHFIDIIAKEQSKKTRALTQSEIDQQKKNKNHKKSEEETNKRNIKPDFNPQENWSVANSFAYSFNQNGQIPYDILQQLVTTDEEGNLVYTDLYTQLDKNFDAVSKQLQQYNNTESYINNINLFKKALKDGDLSPQDKLLGMELGFKSSELDKLNNLIKYKVESVNNYETPIPEIIEEAKQDSISEIPELKQKPLERDDFYQDRIKKYKDNIQKNKDFTNDVITKINFDFFGSPKSIKQDSEEEFQEYLIKFINSKLLTSLDKNFVDMWPVNPYSNYGTPELIKPFIKDYIQYIDPKLYNELGLKFFSKYSTTNMYKHFKDLVDKQNKETISKQAKVGIIKAETGVQVPWRRNFDGTTHQMDNIYKLFTENIQSYDAKQIAESLNKLNSDTYKQLNFEDSDNTLGFKSWNTIFNESGLNNLFGYNENKSDYLGVTTRSRRDFSEYLKNKGIINTGNGDLSWNSESNKWEYTNWSDKSALTTVNPREIEEETGHQSNESGNKGEAPQIKDLILKQLKFKKPLDLNPNGIINSLSGYIANAVANAKKQKIQKDIPIYQEIPTPEKGFRTAYTYDLEKAKNEIMAEATNLQPVTSDVNAYYAAKNEAIKNARNYTTKLDTEINERIHQTANDNQDITFENAVNRTNNVNTNAKYRHDWEVEQKQGEVDYIEANNQSFQNLNKEIKHNIVTRARDKQKKRDAYMNKHIITGIMTTPSNYIEGWTKQFDLIWNKGQNGKLETEQETAIYQQLLSVVTQAASSIMAQYDNIKYDGIGQLHIPEGLKQDYKPGIVIGAEGMKINKQKINNFINKLK